MIFLFHINSIICTLPFKISFVSGRENFRLQKLEMVSCYARKRTCEINVQIQTHACPGGVLPEKLGGTHTLWGRTNLYSPYKGVPPRVHVLLFYCYLYGLYVVNLDNFKDFCGKR